MAYHRHSAAPSARLVDPRAVETLDLLGPTVQFLTPREDAEDAPCVMRGTIPAGGVVPLHSHADPETLLAVSGEVDASAARTTARAGSVSRRAMSSTSRAGGDTRGVTDRPSRRCRSSSAPPESAASSERSAGRSARARRPSGAAIERFLERFLETAERCGYWNATPDENAAVGDRAARGCVSRPGSTTAAASDSSARRPAATRPPRALVPRG
jgi:hypothetical protein